MTFPEDVNEYWDFQTPVGVSDANSTVKFNRTNFEICDTSDGGLDTLIACVKSHISENEIIIWEWKQNCPDAPAHSSMEKLEKHRKIFAQYENNQVCATVHLFSPQ